MNAHASHYSAVAALNGRRGMLGAPFPSDEVEFLVVDSGPTKNAREWGEVAPYATQTSYEKRLVATLGAGSFSFTQRRIDETAVIGTLRVGEVVRESIGVGKGLAAPANAFTRCARSLGAGRYLARLGRRRLDVGFGDEQLAERGSKLVVGKGLEAKLREGYARRLEKSYVGIYGPALGHRGARRPAGEWSGRSELSAQPLASNYEEAHGLLCRPFAPAAVEFVLVGEPYEREPGVLSHELVAYLHAVSVEDRLDAVVGPGNWSTTLERAGKNQVYATLRIFDVEMGDFGGMNGSGFHAQQAQAFKRSAKRHGIGLYLYELDRGVRTIGADDDQLRGEGNTVSIPRTLVDVLRREYAEERLPAVIAEYGEVIDHHDREDQSGDEGDHPVYGGPAPVASGPVRTGESGGTSLSFGGSGATAQASGAGPEVGPTAQMSGAGAVASTGGATSNGVTEPSTNGSSPSKGAGGGATNNGAKTGGAAYAGFVAVLSEAECPPSTGQAIVAALLGLSAEENVESVESIPDSVFGDAAALVAEAAAAGHPAQALSLMATRARQAGVPSEPGERGQRFLENVRDAVRRQPVTPATPAERAEAMAAGADAGYDGQAIAMVVRLISSGQSEREVTEMEVSAEHLTEAGEVFGAAMDAGWDGPRLVKVAERAGRSEQTDPAVRYRVFRAYLDAAQVEALADSAAPAEGPEPKA